MVKLERVSLEAVHCWEPGDHVPRDPATTEFRRRARFHQAQWRQERGHPIGSQPIVPKPGANARLVGSRIPFAYATATAANFITDRARDAARARAEVTEPHQSFDRRRFWADLLSSTALAVNLFADLAADTQVATEVLESWLPGLEGEVLDVRFGHSPGRLDPEYLNSLRDFDCAIELSHRGGTRGIVGIGVRFHEWAKPETPRPSNLARYCAVADRSGVFSPDSIDALSQRSALAEIWLEHLLVLSMLQHRSRAWGWGRFVMLYPERNHSVADACAAYRALLTDPTTFTTLSVEAVLGHEGVPQHVRSELQSRYGRHLDDQRIP